MTLAPGRGKHHCFEDAFLLFVSSDWLMGHELPANAGLAANTNIINHRYRHMYFVMLQRFNPRSNVLQNFWRDGFLYLAIFLGKTCGAMLKQMVERWIFLDEMLL